MNYKILISVLSLQQDPYINLEETIRQTWGKNNDNDIKIIYYYGDSQETYLMNDKLFINSPEGLYNIGKKTLKMFDYCYNNFEFDYMFRTNSSSYINITELKNFLIDKPKKKFYCGHVGNFLGNIKFASGSGYFISRDLVEFVLNNQNEWDHNLIDDVSLGKLLTSHGYEITQGKRCDLQIDSTIDSNHYHYRVKDSTNRNNDILLINSIHNKLNVLKYV